MRAAHCCRAGGVKRRQHLTRIPGSISIRQCRELHAFDRAASAATGPLVSRFCDLPRPNSGSGVVRCIFWFLEAVPRFPHRRAHPGLARAFVLGPGTGFYTS